MMGMMVMMVEQQEGGGQRGHCTARVLHGHVTHSPQNEPAPDVSVSVNTNKSNRVVTAAGEGVIYVLC